MQKLRQRRLQHFQSFVQSSKKHPTIPSRATNAILDAEKEERVICVCQKLDLRMLASHTYYGNIAAM